MLNDLSLFENIPAILLIVDKKGVIKILNNAAKEFLGIDSENRTEKNLIDYLSNNQNLILDMLNTSDPSEFPQSIEVKVQAKNKHTFYTSLSINKCFDEKIDKDFFVISIFDLTHQKMQAELIKESQLRFENIANSAPVMIWITDVSGLFTFVNKIWCDFTGRSLGEELGLNWLQGVHQDEMDSLMNVYKNALDSRITFSYEFRIKRKGNEYRWLMMNGIPRFKDENIFLGLIGTCIDITNQKENEEYIKKINNELEDANKNKDKFFSIISHDLRSPLSGIMSLLDIIVADYDSLEDVEKKEILLETAKTSKSTFTLMENLLDWSRVQTGQISYEPQNISLNLILASIKNLYYQKFKEKEIAINFEIEPDCFVFADSNMTEAILRNLISNAIKFTPDFGSIIISFENYENDILIKVKDTGVGMDQNQISKLFKIDMTHSTVGTSGERGTGLGLLLSKELIEKQGGKIWIESVVNEGTTFYFTLPKVK